MAYWLAKAPIAAMLPVFYRGWGGGLGYGAETGPAFLARNHVSFSDSVVLPLVLRRRITFVAKAEYFEDPKTAWIFRALGQIPIKRTGGSASEGALAAARDVLGR